MSMQDPIADMLNRIKIAQCKKKKTVHFFYTKYKYNIINVLYIYNYIENFYIIIINNIKFIKIILKYLYKKGVISFIQRISKPSIRVYKKYNELNKNHLGIFILSTSHGILSHIDAFKKKIGGELICYIY